MQRKQQSFCGKTSKPLQTCNHFAACCRIGGALQKPVKWRFLRILGVFFASALQEERREYGVLLMCNFYWWVPRIFGVDFRYGLCLMWVLGMRNGVCCVGFAVSTVLLLCSFAAYVFFLFRLLLLLSV